MPEPDDNLLDGCAIDHSLDAAGTLEPEEDDLFVLFAEALDPNSTITVEDVSEMWRRQ